MVLRYSMQEEGTGGKSEWYVDVVLGRGAALFGGRDVIVLSPDLIRCVYRFARENGLVHIGCIPQTPPSIWRIQSNCPTGNLNK